MERFEERISMSAEGAVDNDMVQSLTTDGPLQALGHQYGGMLVHKPLPVWAQEIPSSACESIAAEM